MTSLQEIQIISALVLGVLGFGLGVYNTWVQRREKVPRVKVSLEVGSTYAIPLVNLSSSKPRETVLELKLEAVNHGAPTTLSTCFFKILGHPMPFIFNLPMQKKVGVSLRTRTEKELSGHNLPPDDREGFAKVRLRRRRKVEGLLLRSDRGDLHE